MIKGFVNSSSETFESSSYVEQPKQVEVKAPVTQEDTKGTCCRKSSSKYGG